MPDITELIKKWWKQILAVVVVSSLVVSFIVFSKPLQYVSVVTAVPASSYSSDRSKIFNENVQQLYSTLGTPDDLDLIVGTGNLDTVYLTVAQQYNLYDHYKMNEKGDAAINKAASILKKNTKVMKSEYGELKVKVWDTDKNLSPQLANAIMDQLQELDSISVTLPENKMVLQNKLMEYEKLIGEFQLMVDSKPPVIIPVERAKGSDWPDRPKRMQILIATAVLSFLFGLFLALILERRKNTRQ